MLFAGQHQRLRSPRASLAEFEPLLSYSAGGLHLAGRPAPATSPIPNANRDSTDFVKALADIYALLSHDIADSRLNAADRRPGRRAPATRSSSSPTATPPTTRTTSSSAATRWRRIRQLQDPGRRRDASTPSTSSTRSQPISSVCDLVRRGAAGCPLLLIINQDAERLEKMAQLGGGDFRDFRNNEPINFLNFKIGQTRRAYVLKEFVASNISAPPDSPPDAGGLRQRRPDRRGGAASRGPTRTTATPTATASPTASRCTSPSWGRSFRIRWASCCPTAAASIRVARQPARRRQRLRRPPRLRRADHRHQLRRSIDCDNDGIPDGIEWQLGTQPSTQDLDEDPDNDGLANRDEVRMHTNPLVADTANADA